MPMVGIASAAVAWRATSAGMDSNTIAKTPAASSARASAISFSASRSSVACRRYPPNWCTDCGSRPRWPITGMPISTSRWATSSIAAPPSILTAAAPPSWIRRPALRTASLTPTWKVRNGISAITKAREAPRLTAAV